LNGRRWAVRNANDRGVFDLAALKLDGPATNSFAFLVIRIKSPKPLDDLLAEPNVPRLSFSYASDDGCQVFLNRKRLASHPRVGPIEGGSFRLDHLPLKLGWNELAIQVVQAGGEWKFAGRFECSDRRFLQSLTFAAHALTGEE
jgi:beta-galactosidase